MERLARGAVAVSMAWRSSPRTAAAWIGVLGVAALLPVAVAWVGKEIVDAVVAGEVERALAWVVGELLLVACMAAAQRGGSMLKALLGVRLGLSLNLEILRKAPDARAAALSRSRVLRSAHTRATRGDASAIGRGR